MSRTLSFFARYTGIAFLISLIAPVEPKVEAVARFILRHKFVIVLGAILEYALFHFLPSLRQTGIDAWILWAAILVFQNFAFTFVSRARNSGSVLRHLKAGFLSNAVWFASQAIMLGEMFGYITGKHGMPIAFATGAFYTAFTLAGSVLAHYFALQTETGKSAVGANKKYAQIAAEEWEEAKTLLSNLASLANQIVVTPPLMQRVSLEPVTTEFVTTRFMPPPSVLNAEAAERSAMYWCRLAEAGEREIERLRRERTEEQLKAGKDMAPSTEPTEQRIEVSIPKVSQ